MGLCHSSLLPRERYLTTVTAALALRRRPFCSLLMLKGASMKDVDGLIRAWTDRTRSKDFKLADLD